VRPHETHNADESRDERHNHGYRNPILVREGCSWIRWVRRDGQDVLKAADADFSADDRTQA